MAVESAPPDRAGGILAPRREHVETALDHAAPAPRREQRAPDAAVEIGLGSEQRGEPRRDDATARSATAPTTA
jgi:hypothetical protein